MQADNNKCGVGVAYNSKVGGKTDSFNNGPPSATTVWTPYVSKLVDPLSAQTHSWVCCSILKRPKEGADFNLHQITA